MVNLLLYSDNTLYPRFTKNMTRHLIAHYLAMGLLFWLWSYFCAQKNWDKTRAESGTRVYDLLFLSSIHWHLDHIITKTNKP